jgi:hypothetical protein
MIRHQIVLADVVRAQQPETVSCLRGSVVAPTIVGILVIRPITPFCFNSSPLAAVVVGAIAMAVVATLADHYPFATPGTEENPIAIAC